MRNLETRAARALAAIDERWDAWATMPKRIVEVLSRTLNESAVAIYHWEGASLAFDAHTFRRDPAKLPWLQPRRIHEARFYDPDDPGEHANRVVVGAQLRSLDRRRWELFERGFLEPMERGDQMRSLITGDDGQMLAFLGVFAPRGRRAEPSEQELFGRLLHPISERMRIWKLLAQTSSERAAILELVAEITKPAFIIGEQGIVLFANAPARLMYDRPPEHLVRALLAPSPPPWVRRITITEGPRRLYVCFPRENDVSLERLGLWAAREWALPVRLQQCAAKVIAGRTDKQIAVETNLSHSTVRTYIQMIYRHVGVSNRSALVREALRITYG